LTHLAALVHAARSSSVARTLNGCDGRPSPAAGGARDRRRPTRSVRTTLLFLRVRAGERVGTGRKGPARGGGHDRKGRARRRPVTARRTLRAARLIEVGVDDLLDWRHMFSRVCSHYGHPPDDFDDFVDEETVVRDQVPAGERVVLDGGRR